MAGNLPNLLKTVFPFQGIGWAAVSLILGVIAIVGVGALITLWSSLRDAISDFLNADLEVWHLLIVLAVVAVVAAVVGIGAFRKLAAPDGGGRQSLNPREIDYLDVKWPVIPVLSLNTNSITHFDVGTPMCPVHRSTFSWDIGGDEHPGEVVIPLTDDEGDDLDAENMIFRCPNDGAKYDLRGNGYGMRRVKDAVNNLAMGQRRTTLEATRGNLNR